ncbi:hypothetical protein PUN28_004312 [Cardiocondyla obscurior]|uniref:Uncharacterized protein n=1 Tax=Cardiocondyla obscurior TaxID=286306 RepID=A0AAW2GF52_9HYME
METSWERKKKKKKKLCVSCDIQFIFISRKRISKKRAANDIKKCASNRTSSQAFRFEMFFRDSLMIPPAKSVAKRKIRSAHKN